MAHTICAPQRGAAALLLILAYCCVSSASAGSASARRPPSLSAWEIKLAVAQIASLNYNWRDKEVQAGSYFSQLKRALDNGEAESPTESLETLGQLAHMAPPVWDFVLRYASRYHSVDGAARGITARLLRAKGWLEPLRALVSAGDDEEAEAWIRALLIEAGGAFDLTPDSVDPALAWAALDAAKAADELRVASAAGAPAPSLSDAGEAKPRQAAAARWRTSAAAIFQPQDLDLPAGSRCCACSLHVSTVMWVPPKSLKRNFGGKLVCPYLDGTKWSHAPVALCDQAPFLYTGTALPCPPRVAV
eukprot:TRINITY_DN18181_c0_g1_i1.p1 TRINITY_DN18181_c0_g1~~TRINITY_DN18181_c0_g1_i1.p1  ORF type:complete len:304 (+),score=53.55 TRINITY_DN18181_c0_g1_i1:76-987(+)